MAGADMVTCTEYERELSTQCVTMLAEWAEPEPLYHFGLLVALIAVASAALIWAGMRDWWQT